MIKVKHERLCAIIFIALTAILFMMRTEVVLDDSYIYLRAARNFLDGYGFVLNPGDNHYVLTSSLWPFLIVTVAGVSGLDDLVIISEVLYALFLGGASYFLYDLTREKLGLWAILPTLAVFFNFVSMTSVGGEIALVYFTWAGVLWTYLQRKNMFFAGVFLGLAYLSRGELVLLVVPLAGHYLWTAWRDKKPLSQLGANIATFAIGAAILPVAWHAYYFLQFGNFLPETLHVKMIQGRNSYWTTFTADYPRHVSLAVREEYSLALLVLSGIAVLPWLSLFLIVFTLIHFLSYHFIGVPNYHWYYFDLHFVVFLLIIIGIPNLINLSFGLFRKKQIPFFSSKFSSVLSSVTILMSVFLASNVLAGFTRWSMPPDKGERYNSYVRVADFLNKNMEERDVLLVPEVGIIGYFMDKGVIRDINGLASPGLTEDNLNDWVYFINKYRPKFLTFHFGKYPPNISVNTDDGLIVYKKVFISNPKARKYRAETFQRID